MTSCSRQCIRACGEGEGEVGGGGEQMASEYYRPKAWGKKAIIFQNCAMRAAPCLAWETK